MIIEEYPEGASTKHQRNDSGEAAGCSEIFAQHPPQSLETPLYKGEEEGWVFRQHSPQLPPQDSPQHSPLRLKRLAGEKVPRVDAGGSLWGSAGGSVGGSV